MTKILKAWAVAVAIAASAVAAVEAAPRDRTVSRSTPVVGDCDGRLRCAPIRTRADQFRESVWARLITVFTGAERVP